MRPYRIGLIGHGHIARVQHGPCIAASDRFCLTSVFDPAMSPCDPRSAADVPALLASGIDAVVIATPPAPRFALAREALAAGKHVLLEKPPVRTFGELAVLRHDAEITGLTLFASWHSRHSSSVSAARAAIAESKLARISVVWHEDVERYHAGQHWIWEPSGLGVLDAGINALSIVTALSPEPILIEDAEFRIPVDAQTPLAVRARGRLGPHGGVLDLDFDWDVTDERREIAIDLADGGRLDISRSGRDLFVDGVQVMAGDPREYQGIYAHFAELIDAGASDVDGEPMRVVADMSLIARRVAIGPLALPS